MVLLSLTIIITSSFRQLIGAVTANEVGVHQTPRDAPAFRHGIYDIVILLSAGGDHWSGTCPKAYPAGQAAADRPALVCSCAELHTLNRDESADNLFSRDYPPQRVPSSRHNLQRDRRVSGPSVLSRNKTDNGSGHCRWPMGERSGGSTHRRNLRFHHGTNWTGAAWAVTSFLVHYSTAYAGSVDRKSRYRASASVCILW